MAKTLSFTDTSARTVKIGDTTTSFTLVCGNDNVATDLTNATSITAKLGNASGYLKSFTVDPTSLADPTTGQVTVKFNADLMTNLPAGGYAIEVWVVDSTGTSIYPSDGSTGFTITNNIQSANGSTITTITFDDFVKELNKAASTIAKGDKGDKGDTGTVDNAGLTTAPAFQALQTQVNNSAVGTNLLGNSNFSDESFANWAVDPGITNNFDSSGNLVLAVKAASGNRIYYFGSQPLVAGMTYAISFYAYVDSSSTNSIINVNVGPYLNPTSISVSGNTLTRYTGILKPRPNDSGMLTIAVGAYNSGTVGDIVHITKIKLEKGSVATDWSLNPSEILTQADYAKIKAAIVALGGSLS